MGGIRQTRLHKSIGPTRLSSRLYRPLLRGSFADYMGLFCESDDILAGVFVF